ncbi:MAG: alpha-1,4-glucan--maltose-1-phosphate maltosyltransferase [Acidobacteriia bacterium]|nr:alpha-1,4-glucan--maltose-1-phosphate maltosyltransferase [Terriglobia bacterium]
MALVHHTRPLSANLNHLAGRQRTVIESVRPEIDGGRFPIKRVLGETVAVEADIFLDGHDHVAASLLYRFENEPDWIALPMELVENDRWRAEFPCSSIGAYKYTLEAWPDPLETWRADLLKRIEAGQDVSIDLLIGASLIEEAARRAARGDPADRLWSWASQLRNESDPELRKALAFHEDLLDLARHYRDPSLVTRYEKELRVIVDRERARFSSWYELFPRSFGSFRDCESWLPYVASMGFDVLYFPPIHPIGRDFRKGRNNAIAASPDDPGSPWAIADHTTIDPALGTLQDFRRMVDTARGLDLEIALDLAFQTAPDHVYVRRHPEWFRSRPDGTIQYAENPPKKYQDIYPFDFSTHDWPALWTELAGVVEFWIEAGVRIFRVDNPHTKPFVFWEWLIGEIKSRHPDVLFLAEAFTRPKVMYRLGKLGFTQSYAYFAWRNTKQELTEYFTELAAVRDFFRPNLWPNTPDILTAFLQSGLRSAFEIRLILAATLGASYGIYGPAFELLEHVPREPASEEYLHSEKYERKHWDIHSPASLHDFIAQINGIRRDNIALHTDRTLHFHNTDNPHLICYSKTSVDLSNVIVTVVNLDPSAKQWGFVDLDLAALGIDSSHSYQAIDLLHAETFQWIGPRNYVELNPSTKTAHILRLRTGA